MTSLPHRKLAYAGTSVDSCGAQVIENKGRIVKNWDKQLDDITCCAAVFFDVNMAPKYSYARLMAVGDEPLELVTYKLV